jgi:hypothetical protein
MYNLINKTKKEVVKIIDENMANEMSSDIWVFHLGSGCFWQKKYLYIFFEEDIVIRTSIIYKNFWDKKY